ncbi:MAG: hypothetical protein WBB82_11810 [Limnothrix sp.]
MSSFASGAIAVPSRCLRYPTETGQSIESGISLELSRTLTMSLDLIPRDCLGDRQI